MLYSEVAQAMEDPQLSWDAKGVFLLVSAKDGGCTFTDILNKTPQGDTVIKRAIKELLDANYAVKKLTTHYGGYRLCPQGRFPPASDTYGFPSRTDIADNAQSLPQLNPGVYFLLHQQEIVYVGMSKEPTQRIQTHHKNGNFQFDSFFVVECGQSEMAELEGEYIRHYQPIENKKGKV